MTQKTLTCRTVRLGYLNDKVKYQLLYRNQILEVLEGADGVNMMQKVVAWCKANNFTHILWVGPEWYAGLQKKLGK